MVREGAPLSFASGGMVIPGQRHYPRLLKSAWDVRHALFSGFGILCSVEIQKYKPVTKHKDEKP